MRITLQIITALALLFTLPAWGAECGVGGTAKTVAGVEVTRTAEQAAGSYIGADGYWHQCPAARQAPPLLDCAAPTDNPRTWTVGPRICTTAGEAREQRGDRSLRHGEVGVWLQRRGATRGEYLERCTNGQRTVVLAYCRAAK